MGAVILALSVSTVSYASRSLRACRQGRVPGDRSELVEGP